MATPEPTFQVLKQDAPFELRRYASYQSVSQLVRGSDFEGAASVGFRNLFAFITGSNAAKQKISMTAPVTQEPAEDSYRVSFVMPEGMSSVPQPSNGALEITRVSERVVAVVRYSGRSTQSLYEEQLAKLRAWMQSQRLPEKGAPIWSRYNAPWTPWFLRRNEIWIPTDGPQTPSR